MLFLAISLITVATGIGMASEEAEAAKTTEAAAEATAESEPYEVVDYRNFFGIDARSLVSRAPAFVRPMVVTEVENYARAKGSSEITREIVETVKAKWSDSMDYS